MSDDQDAIDWKKVAAAGISFAYVKATEGLTITDAQFSNNWSNPYVTATGAYHFFHPDDNGVLQAQHFLDVVGKMQPGKNLPPVVDVETFDSQSAGTVIRELQNFISTVKTATGMTPIIYTDLKATWNALDNPIQFFTSPLWIAYPDASEPVIPPPWSNWLIWQYSWTATVPGIDGAVDMNMFNGTAEQLQDFLEKGTLPY